MELLRNKASGKCFIGIDEEDDGDALLMITPNGDVKHLELHLFERLDRFDPEDDRLRSALTPQQMKAVYRYKRG